jgi:sigma-B regulation protein RsbU (phosphoserine phosphatase)
VKFPVRTKLVLIVGVPLAAVYAATVWILAGELGARSMGRLEAVAEDNAASLARQVDARLGRVEQVAETTAGILAGRSGFGDDLPGALAAAAGSDPIVARAWGLSGSTVCVVSRAPGEPQVRGPLPASELHHPALTPWPPEPAGARGWTGASYVAAIARQGSIVLDVQTDALGAFLREAAPQPGTNVILLAPDGALLASAGDVPKGVDNAMATAERTGRGDLVALLHRITAGERGLARLPGVLSPDPRWFAYAPLKSVHASIVAAVPESLVTAFQRSQLRAGIVILSAGLAGIIVVLLIAAAIITRPVTRLSEAVATLGEGNLDAVVTGVTSRDELGDLARGFNAMVADLRGHIEARQREAERRQKAEGELLVARKIQNDLLPKRLPAVPGFSMYAKNLAARHVAGDFYDTFMTPDGRLVFLVADVSGKGLPSAMYMAVSRTVIRRLLAGGAPLAAAIGEASDALEAENVGSMYLTMFAATLDPATGSFRYVNAGHPAPWRVDVSGRASVVGAPTGAPVGLLPKTRYNEVEDRLAAGDRLVVFSDGVPEAHPPDGEFYGDDRLASLLAAGPRGEPGPEMGARVLSAIESYQAGELADDVTVMVVGRLV